MTVKVRRAVWAAAWFAFASGTLAVLSPKSISGDLVSESRVAFTGPVKTFRQGKGDTWKSMVWSLKTTDLDAVKSYVALKLTPEEGWYARTEVTRSGPVYAFVQGTRSRPHLIRVGKKADGTVYLSEFTDLTLKDVATIYASLDDVPMLETVPYSRIGV
jgi:hypothetical protein